jgi:hypothetical protein
MSNDPTTWGVKPAGFVAPNTQEILERIQIDQRTYIDPDWDTDPDGVEGQAAGIVAEQLAMCWEAGRVIHDSFNRANAEGSLLANVGTLTGTVLRAARPTSVVASCTLVAGTILVSGEALASVAGHPELVFTPSLVLYPDGYTAAVGGAQNVTFVATVAGPTVVSPGTLTVISGPVTGWTAVTNVAMGTTGSLTEEDDDFRNRQESELYRSGSATAQAIATDMIYESATGTGVPGILDAWCLENTSAEIDLNGLPPGFIEVVLEGDGTQTADAIGLGIFNAKPAGKGTWGTSMVTIVDPRGQEQTVRYSMIQSVPVYLTYALDTGVGYQGNTLASSSLADALNALADVGGDVLALRAQATALGLAGVLDVTDFHLGLGSTPSGTANIAIGPRQKAEFAAARIVVTS